MDLLHQRGVLHGPTGQVAAVQQQRAVVAAATPPMGMPRPRTPPHGPHSPKMHPALSLIHISTIYVYDNNSTDGTAELARTAGAVVRHEYQQGLSLIHISQRHHRGQPGAVQIL